jgi:hypothetical protein
MTRRGIATTIGAGASVLLLASLANAGHRAWHRAHDGMAQQGAANGQSETMAQRQEAAPAQHPVRKPPTAPVPPIPPMPPTPPTAPASPQDMAQGLADSMQVLGDSMGRMGREFGERMRVHFGPRFRDSIRAEVSRAVEQSKVMRAAAIAQARQASAGAKDHGDKHGIAAMIDRVRHDPEAISLPPTDSFATGDLKIVTDRAGTTGSVATVNGNLDVMGTINGNAIAVDGNVILHPGSHVTGSVLAADGEVQVMGPDAVVDGEIRSIQGVMGPAPVVTASATGSRASRTHDIKLAVSAFGLLMLLGIGVLTFAEEQLDDVTATLANRFGRSVCYGAVGQIALVPVLLALIVALAITIVGILALPFAIVGYAVLAAGVATLGFMAVAEATGTAVLRTPTQASLTRRGAQLRAIITGLGIYGGLWVLTAVVGANSGPGAALRGLVLCITLVAVTAGFGAVLLWRYELRRASRVAKSVSALPAAEAVWQTPTPVAGVAAARRPTPPAVTVSRPPE